MSEILETFVKSFLEEKKKQINDEIIQIHKRFVPHYKNVQITEFNENYYNAAVSIILYEKENKIYTVLIKKTEDCTPHSGQIAFPGGRKEEYDKSPIETALRETSEEIGINVKYLIFVTSLSKIYIPVSDFYVLPVLFYAKKIDDFNIQKEEVEKIIQIPLKFFMNKPKEIKLKIRNSILSIPAWEYKKNIIWGATAMMIGELMYFIKRNKILTKLIN